MVNFVLVIGAPEVFNLPNNEFFRNLTWTLWVPIGFTTASIKDLLQFWFSWFHGVPPLDFCNSWFKNFHQKLQRGDPMKSGKSKLHQIFDTRWCEPYGYPKCPCQVSKKFNIGKVENFRSPNYQNEVEQVLLIFFFRKKNQIRILKFKGFFLK